MCFQNKTYKMGPKPIVIHGFISPINRLIFPTNGFISPLLKKNRCSVKPPCLLEPRMPKNAIQEAHAASLRSLLVCVTFGRLKTGGELLVGPVV